MKVKMAATAILNMLFLSILVKWSISGGSRHFEFHLSFIIRLLLHIFARNLAHVLPWRSYMQVCQNIKQKLNPTWRRPPSLIFAQTSITQPKIEIGE